MKHISAIILKFLMVAVVLEIALTLLTVLSFTDILVISLTVTVAAYLIGDLLILAYSNNTVATVSDVVLTFATIYLFNYWSDFGPISFTDALICSVLVGAGEWIFHKYIIKTVFPKPEKQT
jgi:hypothetical protein